MKVLLLFAVAIAVLAPGCRCHIPGHWWDLTTAEAVEYMQRMKDTFEAVANETLFETENLLQQLDKVKSYDELIQIRDHFSHVLDLLITYNKDKDYDTPRNWIMYQRDHCRDWSMIHEYDKGLSNLNFVNWDVVPECMSRAKIVKERVSDAQTEWMGKDAYHLQAWLNVNTQAINFASWFARRNSDRFMDEAIIHVKKAEEVGRKPPPFV